ncbi:MAG: zinc ribbon domain-containing protein [Gemmatimonadales bacterium]
MDLEAVAAGLLGVAALYVVLQPLLRPGQPKPPTFEPLDPEETVKGVALAALKEIEFDRETGKLSDADYEFLKAKYTGQALEALRAERASAEMSDVEALIAARVRTLRSAVVPAPLTHSSNAPPSCPSCGPPLEPDAVFCSTCGARLPLAGACAGCGAALGPESGFCERCGAQVAA